MMIHNEFRLAGDTPAHVPSTADYKVEVGVYPTFSTPAKMLAHYGGPEMITAYNTEVAEAVTSEEAEAALVRISVSLIATHNNLHSATWRAKSGNAWWAPQTTVSPRLLIGYLRRSVAGGINGANGPAKGLIFAYGSQVVSVEGGRDGHFPYILVAVHNNKRILEVLEVDTGRGRGEAGTSGGATLRGASLVTGLIDSIKAEVPNPFGLSILECKVGVVRDHPGGRYLYKPIGGTVRDVDSYIRTSGNPSDVSGVDRGFFVAATLDGWNGPVVMNNTDWSGALRARWDEAGASSPGVSSSPDEAEGTAGAEMIAAGEAIEAIIAKKTAEEMTRQAADNMATYIDGARGIVSDAVERAEARKILSKKDPAPVAETGLIKGASADNARRLIRLAITPHPVTGEVENVLLIGHTGTGKTSLVEEIAKEAGRPFSRLNLNGQTGVDEFVGRWSLQNGSTIWIDGILPIALREGHHLLLDEANAALPEVNMILQAVLDHARQLRLAEKDGEVIQAHPEFRCYASMNPTEGYPGTKDLNPALASRFTVTITVDYPTLEVEAEVLTDRTGLPHKAALIMAETARKVRVGFAKGTCLTPVGTRDLLAWARMAGRMTKAGAEDIPDTTLVLSYRATIAGRGGGDEPFLLECLKGAGAEVVKHDATFKTVTGEDLGAILRRLKAGADDIKRTQAAAREAIEEATARAGEIFAEAFKKRDEAEAEAVTRQAEVERLNGQLDTIRASLADYILQGFGSVVQGKLAGLVIPSGPPDGVETANGADHPREPREERFTASGDGLTIEGADDEGEREGRRGRMTVSLNGVDLEF